MEEKFWRLCQFAVVLAISVGFCGGICSAAGSEPYIRPIGIDFTCQNSYCVNANCPSGITPTNCVAPCTVKFHFNMPSGCGPPYRLHQGWWTFEDETKWMWTDSDFPTGAYTYESHKKDKTDVPPPPPPRDYSKPGAYKIQLDTEEYTGYQGDKFNPSVFCGGHYERYLIIDSPPPPIAAMSSDPPFTGTPKTGGYIIREVPFTMKFTDLSENKPDSRTWTITYIISDEGPVMKSVNTVVLTSKDPSVTYTFSDAGRYIVKLVSEKNVDPTSPTKVLTDDVEVTVSADSNPVVWCQKYSPTSAKFSQSKLFGVEPLSVTFEDTSGGKDYKRKWDFGDNSQPDTRYLTTHEFAKRGVYTVKLMIWRRDCEPAVYQNSVRVHAQLADMPSDKVMDPSNPIDPAAINKMPCAQESGGPELTRCGPFCVDLLTDPDNCAECSRKCPFGICIKGKCYAECNGVIVDPETDPDNCGGCGKTCGQGMVCEGGTCMIEMQKPELRMFDFVLNIPHQLVSFIGLAPPVGEKTGIGMRGLEMEVIEDPATRSEDDSIEVVMLHGNRDQVQNIVHENDVTVQDIVIRDIAKPAVQEHMIDYSEETPTPVPQTARIANLPTTGIASQPEVISPIALSCPAGQIRCSGICSDLMTDASHCGSCNITCPSGYNCVTGICSQPCGSGLTSCNGACVNLLSDTNNCGACGNVCMNGAPCMSGSCVAQMVTTQPTRLGGVGTTRL